MTTAGKSAGRVSVRAVPDSTDFAPELRAQLEKIERSLKVEVKAVLDDGHLRESLDRLQQKLSGQKVELKADLDAKLASLEVAKIARNRSVDLAVKVNQASLAKGGNRTGGPLRRPSGRRGAP